MIIDTVNKTVTPAGEDLGTIVDNLKLMFPNEEWRTYKIYNPVITITEKEYINPINPYPYFPQIPTYPNPYYEIPCDNPYRITCGKGTTGSPPQQLFTTTTSGAKIIDIATQPNRA